MKYLILMIYKKIEKSFFNFITKNHGVELQKSD